MTNSGRNSRSSFAAYLAAFLIFLSGCAALRPETGIPSLEKLQKENLAAMKANAVIEARLPGQDDKVSAKAIVYLKLPDMARIEVMGPFNGLLAVLVSSGKNCSYHLNGETKRCGEKGNAFFDVSLGSLTPFLMGLATSSSDEAHDESGVTNLAYGSLLMELSDYRDVRGISIPFSIKLSVSDTEMHVKYSSVELNPSEMSGDTTDFFSLLR